MSPPERAETSAETTADASETLADALPPPVLPALVEGAELVGEFKGSGYREPPHLVRLPDGQLVRLPELLYLVVRELHAHRHLAETHDGEAALWQVAEAVGAAAGAQLTADQIIFLVDKKLAPLGITTYSDGGDPPQVKADPFLALKFKVAVLPERATWLLAGAVAWLFRPAVMALAVTVAVVSELWLFGTQPMMGALQQTLLTPTNILVVLGLVVVSSAFHEIGHAGACRYGGVRPGTMGCGIYLVWPAFYTDVTDSYRLGRAGRIRTDLGGVYFNGIFIVGLTVLYLLTGYEPLLVGILSVNLEILQQLLPTLRFDGYYIVSDLVGIPDLFKYIGPIIKRTVLRRPADGRLQALKRWPQAVVTVWVLVVVPVLLGQLVLLAMQVPGLIVKDWHMMRAFAVGAAQGASALSMIAAGLQILLLALPVIGLALITYQLARWLVRVAQRYVEGPPAQRSAVEG